jgi:hypothetical protein
VFFVSNSLSLEYKVEVLIDKPVLQLAIIAVLEVRLSNSNAASSRSFYINIVILIVISRVARGST